MVHFLYKYIYIIIIIIIIRRWGLQWVVEIVDQTTLLTNVISLIKGKLSKCRIVM